MIFSQNNEQQIILNYFKDFKGTFLDLGANDGMTLSNTYQLALTGWSGVCVEASPKAAKRLFKTHKNHKVECFNFAVGQKDGEIILHESGEHLGKGDTSLLSSTKQSEVERWSGMQFEDVLVPLLSFQSVLNNCNLKNFDFISIDIEGMELEVLPQMDLNALECKMICVEFNGKDQYKYDEIIEPQGFRLIHKNLENLIYAR